MVVDRTNQRQPASGAEAAELKMRMVAVIEQNMAARGWVDKMAQAVDGSDTSGAQSNRLATEIVCDLVRNRPAHPNEAAASATLAEMESEDLCDLIMAAFASVVDQALRINLKSPRLTPEQRENTLRLLREGTQEHDGSEMTPAERAYALRLLRHGTPDAGHSGDDRPSGEPSSPNGPACV